MPAAYTAVPEPAGMDLIAGKDLMYAVGRLAGRAVDPCQAAIKVEMFALESIDHYSFRKG